MSPVAINEVRRFTIAGGEPRHRAFNGAVRLTSGEILVFYREGSDHWRTVDSVVKMVRSQDEGESWSAPELVFSEPGWGCGVHHGPAQLSDGRVLLPMTLVGSFADLPDGVFMRGKVYLISSEDGGNSWSDPLQLGPMEGWSWQNNYGRVREMPDGRVFVPGGGQKVGEELRYSGYFVSHDGGRTFTDRVNVSRGLAGEIDLAPLPGGRWIAMVRDLHPPNYLHQAYSKDEGRTWSAPVSSGIMGHCPSFLALPSGTLLLGHRQVDPSLSDSDRRAGKPGSFGSGLAASTDGGASWEHAADIYVPPGGIWDCAYPSMVLLDDGRVFCTYYTEFVDGNSDIEGLIFEVAE
jgi:hypothetical protein